MDAITKTQRPSQIQHLPSAWVPIKPFALANQPHSPQGQVIQPMLGAMAVQAVRLLHQLPEIMP